MRQQHDSGYLEAALRQSLARRRAPASLKARVMAGVRAEAAHGGHSPAGSRLTWLLRLRASWALGACAATAAAALLWAVLPLRVSRQEPVAVAVDSPGVELAEVLQLAGSKWTRAQEAALSPIQEDGHE